MIRKENKIKYGLIKSFKERLDNNDIKMYLTHNKGKPIVIVRFTRTLKNKIYKHVTAVSKKAFIMRASIILLINTKTHIME